MDCLPQPRRTTPTALARQCGAILLLLAAACVPAGCAAGGRHGLAPAGGSVTTPDTARALALQSAVMGMSDEWNAALGSACFQMQRACGGDMECMWVTQAFLRNGMGASLDIAVGPNPGVSILDMLVLSSLGTWALEHHWAGHGIPPELGLATARDLAKVRDSLWSEAAEHVDAGELARLRVLIDAWIARHHDQAIVSFVRLADFASDRNQLTIAERAEAGGLLSQIADVSSAVDDARLLGERALWYSARYPYVLGQQAEMTALRLTQTISAEASSQRQALLGGVAKEREAIIAGLAEQERTLTPVLAEARGTIAEARALSTELQKVVGAVDGLVARFDSKDPNGKGLTFAELESLVREAGASAAEARGLIEASSRLVDSDRVPAAAASVDRLMRDLLDRALWGAAGIVVLLVGGLVLLRLVPGRAPSSAQRPPAG